MSQYTEIELKNIWVAYRGGMKKSTMMDLMDKSAEEIKEMLDQAQEKFGTFKHRKQKEEDPPPVKHTPMPVYEPEEWERPKAQYSNKSWDETIDELLNTVI